MREDRAKQFSFIEHWVKICKTEISISERNLLNPAQTRREVFGSDCDHDLLAECTFHLGRVARVAGDEAEAQERFAESEEMYKRVFGEDSKNAGLAEVVAKKRKKGKYSDHC